LPVSADIGDVKESGKSTETSSVCRGVIVGAAPGSVEVGRAILACAGASVDALKGAPVVVTTGLPEADKGGA